MERFVQLIVAGGLGLVAGLWLASVFPPSSRAWLAGVALAVLGSAGLAVGIEREIQW